MRPRCECTVENVNKATWRPGPRFHGARQLSSDTTAANNSNRNPDTYKSETNAARKMRKPLEQLSRNSPIGQRLKTCHCWPFRRQLICRLPFLVIWSVLVIIFIYKSLSNNQDHVSETEHVPGSTFGLPFKAEMSLRRETRVSSQDDYNQLMMDENHLKMHVETTPIVERIVNKSFYKDKQIHSTLPSTLQKTSTVEKTTTEYNRKSKVFILLMQSASNAYVYGKQKRSPSLRMHSSKQDSLFRDENFTRLSDRSLKIPRHISILVDILEAHRIDYTIESTRLGLPTTLLTDDSEANNQFSVIVIDNFLKYTKLDRWMRDQLDRHCRKNKIGVVTFLQPEELDNNIRPVTTKSGESLTSGRPIGLTTEETLTDQFPLVLKPIDLRAFAKKSVYDYQLNDQSSILRILKRKRNFTVSSELNKDNTESLPWISMSSDHVTYEPLTWARLDPLSVLNRFISRNRRSTSTTMFSHEDNGIRPSVIEVDAKRVQDDYAAYEPHDISTQAAAKLDVARIGTTQGYSKNQLRVAMERNLRKSTVVADNKEEAAIHVNSTMMHGGGKRHPYMSGNGTSDSITTTNNDIAEDYGTIEPELQVLSMFDRGLYDGIKRVIFGRANDHWLDRIILLDAIEHLSSGRVLTPLERFIQIDIDDIFVGERGKRMNRSDVDALIEAQESFAHLIDGGFKFNLGFSGKYFKHGDEIENAGDEYIISKADHFNWFCHTWSHSKAHLANDTDAIETELRKNLQFASQHKLPLIGHGGPLTSEDEEMPETYAIAPHHSGGKLSYSCSVLVEMLHDFGSKKRVVTKGN